MAEARIGAGFKYIFYGIGNSDGYLIGNTASGATAGAAAGQGMSLLEGARTIPVGIPEDEIVNVTGSDEPEVSFNFPSADLPSGRLETSVQDLDFEALAQGSKVQSIGDLNVGVRGPSGTTQPDMLLLLQRRSKKWAAGVRGVKAWDILLILKATVTPLGGDWQERTFNPIVYNINMQKGDRLTWGATLSDASHGTTKAPMIPVESDNPIHVHAFIGNNSQDTFTLAYTPKTAAKVHVYVDGVKQIVTTHYSVSGKTVTFVSAPGTNEVVNILYEIDEDDIS